MPTRYLSLEDQARRSRLRGELWELLKTADPADPDHDLRQYDMQVIEEELEDLALEEFQAWLRDFKARAKLTPRRKTEGHEE